VKLSRSAIHEELMKHKKNAIEWGVLGFDREILAEEPAMLDKPRDKSGLGLLEDKTGFGLGWGHAPKDGRGLKSLKSIWKDWADAEEFKAKFELLSVVLSVEVVERWEVERERASR
jgi:chromatin structure-remodeling complex subunit SFH1